MEGKDSEIVELGKRPSPLFLANSLSNSCAQRSRIHDAAGRLTLLSAHGGTLQRAYGPLGEVTTETRPPA